MAALTQADIALLQALQPLLARLIAQGPEIAPTPALQPVTGQRRPIAWGQKVSALFRERVWWICDTLAFDPDDLMSCMAWETGRSFRADIKNAAGSGATGLIQFMPATAKALGTTTAALAKMSAEDQLNYVYKYFRGYAGRFRNLADMYMAILWPGAVGKPDEHILFERGTVAYKQNAGLDSNRNGFITKAETAARLYAMKAEGLRLAA